MDERKIERAVDNANEFVDNAMNPDMMTLDEADDFLGTLISDLQTKQELIKTDIARRVR